MATNIIVEAACYTSSELEAEVDKDINEFEAFFKSLGNDSLALGERAVIKTYLYFKTHSVEDLAKLPRPA